VYVGKRTLEKASKSNPCYVIEIEKNGEHYVKTEGQLEKVPSLLPLGFVVVIKRTLFPGERRREHE